MKYRIVEEPEINGKRFKVQRLETVVIEHFFKKNEEKKRWKTYKEMTDFNVTDFGVVPVYKYAKFKTKEQAQDFIKRHKKGTIIHEV